jgi:hypothetical protein
VFIIDLEFITLVGLKTKYGLLSRKTWVPVEPGVFNRTQTSLYSLGRDTE